jgi:methyl-accepting chemotaxis protein
MQSLNIQQSKPESGYFSHHGWLAPGIRLFRRLGFPAKSAWILGAMMVPMVILLLHHYISTAENIASSSLERQGLTYVSGVTDLLHELTAFREAAISKGNDLSPRQRAVEAVFIKVQRLESELGTTFGGETKSNFAKLSKSVQALLKEPVKAGAEETYFAHIAATDDALSVLGDIGDGSQLSLDPELDTYHSMNLAVIVGPQYVEYLTRLRDLSVLTLSEASGKSIPHQRLRAMDQNLTLIGYIDPIYETSYEKAIEAFPEVSASMNMKGVDSSRNAFLTSIEKQIMVDIPEGDSGALLVLANAALDKQLELNTQIAKRLDQRLAARIDRISMAMWRSFAIAGAFLLIALYLLLCFYRVTKGGLELISSHLQELAEGDLRRRPIAPLGKDEPAMLIFDLHKVYDSLHNLICSVRHSASELTNTSAEVSRVSLDLSNRTENAATDLADQAASVQHINDQINQSALRTQEAAVMAGGNADVAEKGGQIINNVVSTMQSIQASSSRIGDIIGTIDGIAFQTNILALNAAVEAARAGESGRGFAVVATEVRSLASRSASAAREIKALITDSETKIINGARVVEEAGRNVSEIVANAKQINMFLDEISNATREQASAVAKVVQAIVNLDCSTQQNATIVEETSASAGALNSQASQLVDEISRFRIE